MTTFNSYSFRLSPMENLGNTGLFGPHEDVLTDSRYMALADELGQPDEHPDLWDLEKQILLEHGFDPHCEYFRNRGI